jgi:hypothetical protein
VFRRRVTERENFQLHKAAPRPDEHQLALP